MGDVPIDLHDASDVLDKADTFTTQAAEWVEAHLPAIVAGEQAATDKLRELIDWWKGFGTGDDPVTAPPVDAPTGG